MARLVAEREPADGRLAVEVGDRELHRDGRLHVEQHRHFAAEAEVLGPLADVEADRRLALAGLAAVDQGDGVLDLQAAEAVRHRRRGEHLDLEEPARLRVVLGVALVRP